MPATPSRFESNRGKCLDAAWVANVSATLGIDPGARDSQQRRIYPWLGSALKFRRFSVCDLIQYFLIHFQIKDPRHSLSTSYKPTCFASGEQLHGVGEQIDSTTGKQINQGTFQGAFTIEWNGWPTHSLSSSLAAILIQEVVRT